MESENLGVKVAPRKSWDYKYPPACLALVALLQKWRAHRIFPPTESGNLVEWGIGTVFKSEEVVLTQRRQAAKQKVSPLWHSGHLERSVHHMSLWSSGFSVGSAPEWPCWPHIRGSAGSTAVCWTCQLRGESSILVDQQKPGGTR